MNAIIAIILILIGHVLLQAIIGLFGAWAIVKICEIVSKIHKKLQEEDINV